MTDGSAVLAVTVRNGNRSARRAAKVHRKERGHLANRKTRHLGEDWRHWRVIVGGVRFALVGNVIGICSRLLLRTVVVVRGNRFAVIVDFLCIALRPEILDSSRLPISGS